MKWYTKKSIVVSMLDLYLFIFIFTMFNREFRLLGFDLRYILVVVGIILILVRAVQILVKKKPLIMEVTHVLLLLLIIISFISNIFWYNNGLEKGIAYSSINILYTFNFISILVFILNKDYIYKEKVFKMIIFSGIVLFISILFIMFDIPLGSTMDSGYNLGVSGETQVNFFGGNYRIAGYAQDANYTTFFMVILLATTIYTIKDKVPKLILCIISIIGIMISASKTIVVGLVIAITIISIEKSKNRYIKNLYLLSKKMVVICVGIIPIIAMYIIERFDINIAMQTMSTRIIMWRHSIELFKQNPFLGNGLTSFRSYFAQSYGGWYVQQHSTVFQILSETGIISLIIFIVIFFRLIKTKNWYSVLLITVFLVFSTTTELMYLSVMPFIVCLLPIMLNKNEYKIY